MKEARLQVPPWEQSGVSPVITALLRQERPLDGARLAEATAADGGRLSTWLCVCRPGLEYCSFPVSRLVFSYAHTHAHTHSLTHARSHPLAHTRTLTHARSHTLAHTRTLTHARSPTLSHTCMLTLHHVSFISGEASSTSHPAAGADGRPTTRQLHPARAPESSWMLKSIPTPAVWLQGGEGKGKQLS